MFYFKLLRIQTLLLSAASIALGVLLAFFVFPNSSISFLQITLLFLTAFCLQIVTNIANDYGDGKRGIDGKDRVEFVRVFSKKILLYLGFFIILSLFFGVWLVWVSFKEISLFSLLWVVLGIFALAAALKYSMGKSPYAASGFGDISVFIFFGWVAVLGSFFLIQKVFFPSLFLEASAIGFLAVSVLNLNNIRDLESDKQGGRRTIAVLLGEKNAKIYQQILVWNSLFLFLLAGILRIEQYFQWVVFLFFIPLIYRSYLLKENKENYNEYLKQQCLFIFLFTLTYAGSFIF